MTMAGAVMALNVSPVLAVGAQPDVPAPTPQQSAAAAAACAHITTLAAASQAAIVEKESVMTADFTKRLSSITTRGETTTKTVASLRSDTLQKFNESITALLQTKGLTSAQKTAITTYRDALRAAESARETATDTARKTYRAQLSTVLAAHQTALSSAAGTFQASVSGAFIVAKSGCANDGILASLKSSIKTAKETFKSARDDAKVTTSIQQLIATRDGAIRQANADFTQATSDAKKALKQALHE